MIDQIVVMIWAYLQCNSEKLMEKKQGGQTGPKLGLAFLCTAKYGSDPFKLAMGLIAAMKVGRLVIGLVYGLVIFEDQSMCTAATV